MKKITKKFRSNYFSSQKITSILLIVFLLVATVAVVYRVQKTTNLLTQASAEPVKAFPTAEGFGLATLGGRFGKVMLVTDLGDSGVGTLRDCVTSSGPRTCVFKVGGTIALKTGLTIKNPYITIAGQTAPGGGITLKSATSTGFTPLSIQTHDVIIRYITSRPGPGGTNNALLIAKSGTPLYNVMIDHSSFSWATDEVFTSWYRNYDMTFQWNIMSEGLDCSTHPKGCHSKGHMVGSYAGSEDKNSIGSENLTTHHNLIANSAERGPLIQMCGTAQVINNVVYNPAWTFAHQQDNCLIANTPSVINWIGNYHKKGPDSTSSTDLKVIPSDDGVYSGGAKVYVKGNIGPSRTNDTKPESDWVDSGSRKFVVDMPANAPFVTTTSALSAYDQVLSEAGNSKGLSCDGSWLARRDTIDERIVTDVKNNTGKIIDNPSQVGGWATIDPGQVCLDTDTDGFPDAWEIRYFGDLSRGTLDNSMVDSDSDGYTDLEEYLNGTNPMDQVVVIASITPTPIPTPISTPTPTPIPTPISTPTPTPTIIPSPSIIASVAPSPTPTPTIKATTSPTITPIPSIAPQDYIGPSLRLSSGKIFRRTWIAAKATDMSGVKSISLIKNGVVIKKCTYKTTCIYYPSSTATPYTVNAIAIDRSAVENSSTASITIR
jgi:pectate lyase